MAAKVIGTTLLIFVLLEVAARWAAQSYIDDGSTIRIGGIFYLANVTNEGAGLAFGLSSAVWLTIGLAISLAICASFAAAGLLLPALRGNVFVTLGFGASVMVIAVAVLNLGEVLLRKGVTDYFALINIERGSAWIVNAGDIVLYLALALIAIAYSGAFFTIVRGSIRTSGVAG